jgi:MFS family permease
MFVVAGRRGGGGAPSTGIIVFAAVGVAGTAGCLVGGWASDRFGRPSVAVAALVISGACCVASPIFFAAPTGILSVFLMVWGAAVIADSGVFSTALSETTDTRLVSTALTAQTAIGFLLTALADWWLGALDSLTNASVYALSTMTTFEIPGLTLPSRFHMLSALEAVNGVLLFGISTALLFAVMQAHWHLLAHRRERWNDH